jgi:predicted HTH transcriptional regulator
LEALAANAPDVLMGTPESSWLEFKGAPYDLTDATGKLELLKDVTALANSAGGCIVIGVGTERDPTTGRELAKDCRRIPKDRINAKQYQQVLEEGTYPPLRDVEMHWRLEENEKGIFIIEVPPALDGQRPVMVNKVREEGSTREILFGVFQRSDDSVARFLPAEIHAQIQLGRQLQRAGILALPQTVSAAPAVTDGEMSQRLMNDVKDGGFRGSGS